MSKHSFVLKGDICYSRDAYDSFGLFGGTGCPTVMAHCALCSEDEIALMAERQVYVALCPASNQAPGYSRAAGADDLPF